MSRQNGQQKQQENLKNIKGGIEVEELTTATLTRAEVSSNSIQAEACLFQ